MTDLPSLAGPTPPAGPTLIDTSVWIEALRRNGAAAARSAVHGLVEPGLALINPVIHTELLVGTGTSGE
ncbi:MAG: hypothetical protein ACWGMZ_04400, partial [Thermoguttaceae bacterium]